MFFVCQNKATSRSIVLNTLPLAFSDRFVVLNTVPLACSNQSIVLDTLPVALRRNKRGSTRFFVRRNEVTFRLFVSDAIHLSRL